MNSNQLSVLPDDSERIEGWVAHKIGVNGRYQPQEAIDISL